MEVPGMITCRRMTAATRADAARLLGAFLAEDASYLAAAGAYGDGGREALERALDLFLERPEIGFVWLALDGERAVAACVVCYAISTSRGTLVAKLDDVSVAADMRGVGVGSIMLRALATELAQEGITRIDTATHQDNPAARRFYEKLGFRSLHEERLSWLL
jgi:ribosomal protein S18 acetylase RimI-like enzyme